MKSIREYIAGNYCEECDIFRFNLIRCINSYYIEYLYIISSKVKFTEFTEFSEFTEENYIKLIKKIGSYYEWEDAEGKLTKNIKKKQLKFFSLLFNHFTNISIFEC